MNILILTKILINKFVKYGNNKYPILFPISLLLFLIDIIMLFFNKFNSFTIIAIVLYTLFFGGIFVGFLIDEHDKKKNYAKLY